MAANSGKLVLFSLKTGVDTYTPVLSAKSNSFTINHSTIDTSTKADAGWSSILSGGGVTSFDCSMDGVFLNTEYDKTLRGYGVSGAEFEGKLVTGNGDIFVGKFICTSMDVGGSFDGAETYSFKIQNVGEIVYTAAP